MCKPMVCLLSFSRRQYREPLQCGCCLRPPKPQSPGNLMISEKVRPFVGLRKPNRIFWRIGPNSGLADSQWMIPRAHFLGRERHASVILVLRSSACCEKDGQLPACRANHNCATSLHLLGEREPNILEGCSETQSALNGIRHRRGRGGFHEDADASQESREYSFSFSPAACALRPSPGLCIDDAGHAGIGFSAISDRRSVARQKEIARIGHWHKTSDGLQGLNILPSNKVFRPGVHRGRNKERSIASPVISSPNDLVRFPFWSDPRRKIGGPRAARQSRA